MVTSYAVSMLQLPMVISLVFILSSTTGPGLALVMLFLELASMIPALLFFPLREHTATQTVRFVRERIHFSMVETNQQLQSIVYIWFRLLAAFWIPWASTTDPPFIPESFFTKVKLSWVLTECGFLRIIEIANSNILTVQLFVIWMLYYFQILWNHIFIDSFICNVRFVFFSDSLYIPWLLIIQDSPAIIQHPLFFFLLLLDVTYSLGTSHHKHSNHDCLQYAFRGWNPLLCIILRLVKVH